MKSIRSVYILIALFALSGEIMAEEEIWKNYKENIKVNTIIQKYKSDQEIEVLAKGGDAYSNFLKLLSEFCLVQDAIDQCKDCHSLVVGYAESGGKRVLAGTAPEQVMDIELRKKYIERLAQNESNWRISAGLLEIKRKMLSLLRNNIESLKEMDRGNAKRIVEHLGA